MFIPLASYPPDPKSGQRPLPHVPGDREQGVPARGPRALPLRAVEAVRAPAAPTPADQGGTARAEVEPRRLDQPEVSFETFRRPSVDLQGPPPPFLAIFGRRKNHTSQKHSSCYEKVSARSSSGSTTSTRTSSSRSSPRITTRSATCSWRSPSTSSPCPTPTASSA